MQHHTRVNLLIGTGHFLSHFYLLFIPPLFLAWQREFGVSFAELGLVVAVMSGITAVLQTPVGFLVDRHGARPYLVGGALLMSLSVCAMGAATEFWHVLVLAALSGVGNSVIHPADYAILSGSIPKERMGQSFALHTFSGNLGFAAGPPAAALLLGVMGWRGALVLVGALGVPVVAAMLVQSRILVDQAEPTADPAPAPSGSALLLTRPMLMFFGFFLLGAMAGGGVQAWVVTVLHDVKGLDLAAASTALTGYMAGATGGVLVGGWLVDRTPRDIMVKDAAPPGGIGKVFGFVSAGLPLGAALTPVPFGILIDRGRPDLVLVLVAALLLASLLCMGGARAAAPRPAPAPAPAE